MTRWITASPIALLVASVAAPGFARAGGGVFEYAEDELPYSLNPLHESSMAETRINELLFEGLWGPGYDGSPEPRLADAYELSEDRKTMRIFLKESRRWSDGEPITAKDVEFTVAAYLNPKTRSPDRSRLSFIESATATAEFTVELHFVDPEPDPLNKLFFKIVPAHRFEGTSVDRGSDFWYQPTTSGPFEVLSQDLGSWNLKANNNALRRPSIKSVKAREMPDKNQQVSSLGYGYIQAMINVPAQYLPEIERSRRADLVPYQSKSWWYVGMNERSGDLGKTAVRNALAQAVDLDQALDLIGEGYRISGPYVPSSKFYNHQESVRIIEQDTLGASAMLEAAGYVLDGDWWTRRGKPLRVRLYYRAGLGERGQTVALNLQAQLRRFGVDVSDPIAMDKAVWNEKVFRDRDFDLVLDSWSFDRNENIYDLFHSKGTMNFVGFSNKKVDSLLDKALVETDPVAKVTYLKRVHLLLAQELPYIFCWSLRNYTALRREVGSVYVQPFSYFSQFPDWKLRDTR